MQGDYRVLEMLNDLLTAELTAINQYFIHSKMLKNWGYATLAGQKYKESIQQMKSADDVIERILLLEGAPNMQRMGPVKVGEAPVEMHELDLQAALKAVERLNQAVSLCVSAGDNGTRTLVESILEHEEESVDYLETQLDLIKTLGKENYLAEMMCEGDD